MVRWGLVVTSDSVKRGEKEDRVTPLVEERLKEAGHSLVYRAVVGNDPIEIYYALFSALRQGADVVLLTGGTGPNPRDITSMLVDRVCDKKLPGIGEEFRRRSISAGVLNALMSTALGCVFSNRLVVASPGNPDAVSTMLDVLLPVVVHLLEQASGASHGAVHRHA
ncbi:MAG: molybdopterin-binding protein [Thermoproteota archaeon]